MLLLLLSSSLFLVSCKAQQPPQEPIVINHDKETIATEKEIVNKAINDKTIIPVAPSKSNNTAFDSLVNAKVDEILNKLNYQKQSGDNSLEVKYNALLKQLEINSKIGQTTNKDKVKVQIQIKEVPVLKQVPYPVVQPLTKLQKLLIALGVGTLVAFGVKLILFLKSKTTWV